MSTAVAAHPAVVRYSNGEISAREAAELMGEDATVHDVVFQMRQAGLPLPCLPREEEEASIARAQAMLDRARQRG